MNKERGRDGVGGGGGRGGAGRVAGGGAELLLGLIDRKITQHSALRVQVYVK